MCTVDGCEKEGRRGKDSMCEMHYMRMYRNGHLGKKREPAAFDHSAGYLLVPAAGHPLAGASSHHYEHRVVYYDAHGAGPFDCHWCAKPLSWSSLHIDHLDDDKKNNNIANLVASCPVCNQSRGHEKKLKTWRSKTGVSAFGKTLTLNEWASEMGITRQSILWRLKRGWDVERALSQGRGKTGPQAGVKRK